MDDKRIDNKLGWAIYYACIVLLSAYALSKLVLAKVDSLGPVLHYIIMAELLWCIIQFTFMAVFAFFRSREK